MNKLQKLIDLSKKTGDRIIAFDSNGRNDAFVVMGVDEYEKIVVGNSPVRGLTESELVDKINRDIAIWKSDLQSEENRLRLDKILEENEISDLRDEAIPFWEDDYEDYVEEEDLTESYFTEEDEEDGEEVDDDWHSIEDITRKSEDKNKSERKSPKKIWEIPNKRKDMAEEIIEEDRYYLEDIED